MYDAGFYLWKEQEIVSFSKMFKSALESTQPRAEQVPRTRSWKVKQPVYEAAHLPPCGAEVEHKWSYTCMPPIYLHNMHIDSFVFALDTLWDVVLCSLLRQVSLKYSFLSAWTRNMTTCEPEILTDFKIILL